MKKRKPVRAERDEERKSVVHLLEPGTIAALRDPPDRRFTDRVHRPKRRTIARQAVGCPLCGAQLHPGTLMEHKSNVHGEQLVERSDPIPSPDVPVRLVSGGLPTLGKRR